MDSNGDIFESHFNMLRSCQLLFCYPVNTKKGLSLRLCSVYKKRTIALKSPTAESLECLQATLQITVFPRISSETYSQDTTRTWIKQPQICLLFLPVTREFASGCPWDFQNPSGFYMWKDFIFGTGICF